MPTTLQGKNDTGQGQRVSFHTPKASYSFEEPSRPVVGGSRLITSPIEMRSLTRASSSYSPKHQHKRTCEIAEEEVGFTQPERSSEFAAAAIGEAEEEQRLAEQCRSSFYYKQTKLIRVLMMLVGVKLVAKPTDEAKPAGGRQKLGLRSLALRNVLRPAGLWPECRRSKHCKPGAFWLGRRLLWPPKMSLLTAVYLHYAFAKLLPLSILSLQRHIILNHLKFNVKPQAPRTNNCALDEDLYFSRPNDKAQFERLKSLEVWLKFLGVNMVAWPELSVVVMFILPILPLFNHYIWRLVLRLNQYRSDNLCFMLDPLGERQRISTELVNIVHELILSQSNHKHNLYYGFENSKALTMAGSNCVWRRPMQASASGGSSDCPKLLAADSHKAAATVRRRLLNDQVRRLRYLQVLLKFKQLKQVDPYIVSSEWHRTLLYNTHRSLKVILWLCLTLAPMVMVSEILYDLCEATRLRLEMVECKKWRPQGGTRITTPLDHLYLDELKPEEQLDAYKTHDGSMLSFLKLALFIESTSYFSLRRVICWLEGLLAGFVYALYWLVMSTVYLGSTYEKIVWLHQLDQQVDRAANEVTEHAHLARRFGPKQEDDERLLNTLTNVYLNYELFRRQQNEHLMLTDPISVCITLSIMMISLIFFFSGLSLDKSSPILIFSFFALLLGTINLFLVASSYRLKRMEKIMVKATRIVAHCSSSPIQLSYPAELWRRQVRDESCRRYASRLFGIHVTYETVISVNGYAIALLLILLKPQLGIF